MSSIINRIIKQTIRNIGRVVYRKHIWLVSDREWEAGDNGEAFFKFLQSKENVNSVFALSKDSKDFERMKSIGKVVNCHSLFHKFLLCVADVNVSSHELHMAGHAETPQFFLSHGITNRDLHDYYNGMNHKNYYTIACSSTEKKLITSEPYEIKPEQVFLTGYPRYDYLYKKKGEKIITFAYSWRSCFWNITKEDLVKTDYFKVYSTLFECRKLIEMVRSMGYSIRLKLHPRMEGYKDVFTLPEGIEFWDEKSSYREMYEKSDLIVTDYSSAIYDFAYLKKPIVYYQPDYDWILNSKCRTFYEYDYVNKGMGDVTRNTEELYNCIESYLKTDCAMKELYSNRVDAFFEYNDRNNCERVYEAISSVLDAKYGSNR